MQSRLWRGREGKGHGKCVSFMGGDVGGGGDEEIRRGQMMGWKLEVGNLDVR
jgi:hypothetical protein